MTSPYPPMPRKRSKKGEKKEEKAPSRSRFSCWADRWGADLLLVLGAGCLCAGVGWIFPPAGLIAAGALLIVGGVLWAKGGDGP